MSDERVELKKCAYCHQFPVVQHDKLHNGGDMWSVYCRFYACNNMLDAVGDTRDGAVQLWNKQQERTRHERNK